jgi:hypothetical protein
LFAQVRRQLLTIAESVRALFFFFRRAHCALKQLT